MSEPLLILGASGNARSIFAIALAMNEAVPNDPPWDLLGFAADGIPDLEPIARLGQSVVGGTEDLSRLKGARYTVGAGTPRVKRLLSDRAEAAGLKAATLVHPSAVIDPDVEIGAGSTISRFVAVTTNVRVGKHSTLAMHVSLAHDCRVGDYVFAGQAVVLAGGVVVEDGVFLGASSAVHQDVHIGAGAVTGMGAVVLHDVPAQTTVVGVPARALP
jgi:sugar O-acyltransferase (sialic acid O-acetyltransferase NeuD family)